jgi:hypothetical protein
MNLQEQFCDELKYQKKSGRIIRAGFSVYLPVRVSYLHHIIQLALPIFYDSIQQ